MSQLPRRLDLSSPQNLLAFGDDVIEFLRTLPRFEIVTFTSDGTFPLYVETAIQRPMGVIRMHTYETRNPGVAVSSTGIGWRVSDNPTRPGIVVTNLDGLTSGTDYELIVLVVGERS